MSNSLRSRSAASVRARDDLLTTIVADVHHDNRLGAAWLGGSFGRGEHDTLSDLDLRRGRRRCSERDTLRADNDDSGKDNV